MQNIATFPRIQQRPQPQTLDDVSTSILDEAHEIAEAGNISLSDALALMLVREFRTSTPAPVDPGKPPLEIPAFLRRPR